MRRGGLIILVIVTALLWLGPPSAATAQTTLTEITPFSFGRFSLRNNTAAHELIVNAATNIVTADAPFVVDIDPQRGEYLLEGFDPGEEITITIDDGGLTLNGGGGTEVFATVDYTISPSPVIAGGGGDVTFYVGATLRTLGNGVTYPTGTYNDDLDIQFDWVP